MIADTPDGSAPPPQQTSSVMLATSSSAADFSSTADSSASRQSVQSAVDIVRDRRRARLRAEMDAQTNVKSDKEKAAVAGASALVRARQQARQAIDAAMSPGRDDVKTTAKEQWQAKRRGVPAAPSGARQRQDNNKKWEAPLEIPESDSFEIPAVGSGEMLRMKSLVRKAIEANIDSPSSVKGVRGAGQRMPLSPKKQQEVDETELTLDIPAGSSSSNGENQKGRQPPPPPDISVKTGASDGYNAKFLQPPPKEPDVIVHAASVAPTPKIANLRGGATSHPAHDTVSKRSRMAPSPEGGTFGRRRRGDSTTPTVPVSRKSRATSGATRKTRGERVPPGPESGGLTPKSSRSGQSIDASSTNAVATVQSALPKMIEGDKCNTKTAAINVCSKASPRSQATNADSSDANSINAVAAVQSTLPKMIKGDECNANTATITACAKTSPQSKAAAADSSNANTTDAVAAVQSTLPKLINGDDCTTNTAATTVCAEASPQSQAIVVDPSANKMTSENDSVTSNGATDTGSSAQVEAPVYDRPPVGERTKVIPSSNVPNAATTIGLPTAALSCLQYPVMCDDLFADVERTSTQDQETKDAVSKLKLASSVSLVDAAKVHPDVSGAIDDCIDSVAINEGCGSAEDSPDTDNAGLEKSSSAETNYEAIDVDSATMLKVSAYIDRLDCEALDVNPATVAKVNAYIDSLQGRFVVSPSSKVSQGNEVEYIGDESPTQLLDSPVKSLSSSVDEDNAIAVDPATVARVSAHIDNLDYEALNIAPATVAKVSAYIDKLPGKFAVAPSSKVGHGNEVEYRSFVGDDSPAQPLDSPVKSLSSSINEEDNAIEVDPATVARVSAHIDNLDYEALNIAPATLAKVSAYIDKLPGKFDASPSSKVGQGNEVAISDDSQAQNPDSQVKSSFSPVEDTAAEADPATAARVSSHIDKLDYEALNITPATVAKVSAYIDRVPGRFAVSPSSKVDQQGNEVEFQSFSRDSPAQGLDSHLKTSAAATAHEATASDQFVVARDDALKHASTDPDYEALDIDQAVVSENINVCRPANGERPTGIQRDLARENLCRSGEPQSVNVNRPYIAADAGKDPPVSPSSVSGGSVPCKNDPPLRLTLSEEVRGCAPEENPKKAFIAVDARDPELTKPPMFDLVGEPAPPAARAAYSSKEIADADEDRGSFVKTVTVTAQFDNDSRPDCAVELVREPSMVDTTDDRVCHDKVASHFEDFAVELIRKPSMPDSQVAPFDANETKMDTRCRSWESGCAMELRASTSATNQTEQFLDVLEKSSKAVRSEESSGNSLNQRSPENNYACYKKVAKRSESRQMVFVVAPPHTDSEIPADENVEADLSIDPEGGCPADVAREFASRIRSIYAVLAGDGRDYEIYVFGELVRLSFPFFDGKEPTAFGVAQIFSQAKKLCVPFDVVDRFLDANQSFVREGELVLSEPSRGLEALDEDSRLLCFLRDLLKYMESNTNLVDTANDGIDSVPSRQSTGYISTRVSTVASHRFTSEDSAVTVLAAQRSTGEDAVEVEVNDGYARKEYVPSADEEPWWKVAERVEGQVDRFYENSHLDATIGSKTYSSEDSDSESSSSKALNEEGSAGPEIDGTFYDNPHLDNAIVEPKTYSSEDSDSESRSSKSLNEGGSAGKGVSGTFWPKPEDSQQRIIHPEKSRDAVPRCDQEVSTGINLSRSFAAASFSSGTTNSTLAKKLHMAKPLKNKNWQSGKTWGPARIEVKSPRPINAVAAATSLLEEGLGTRKSNEILFSASPWRHPYVQRTGNHDGFFDIDVYSLYVGSVAKTSGHPMDIEPWESRSVKQRFLYEQSISFSRNWFGCLTEKKANKTVREPVCRPRSMEMPMELGEWTEDWYQQPRAACSPNAVFGTDGRYDKYFDDEESDDGWEDTPECGKIRNVRLKIGERISRVTPDLTSSLRKSRWRKKHFPNGFPYH